jgi:pimeloyl-ACP methyl ester carboxylesterase
VHAIIEALGVGPVEMFASSGGAVTALALVSAYPNDVTTLVAHEPPLIPVLPDAAAAERARAGVRDAYEAKGSGAGMAAFIAMTIVARRVHRRLLCPARAGSRPVRMPPRTTAPVTTRCCPTGPGRSPAIVPTSTHLTRRRPAS